VRVSYGKSQGPRADDAGDGSLTLSNGEVSQTLSLDTLLDEGKVADGTTLVANFDRLGIRVFLDGIGAGGVAGSYRDRDLDGRSIVIEDASGGVFQLGGDAVGADRLEYDLSDMTSQGTVVDIADISILTQSSARDALARIDGAVARVARERGAVGAIVNRLEHTLNVTTTSIEGIAASEAALRDADIALEVSALARNEILAGLSRSVMTQARVSTNIVMSLLTQ
jgi:flagellin